MNCRPAFGSKPLHRFRHIDTDGLLRGLLAVLLFAQALLPIQSHTRLVMGENGRLVLICTLKGPTQVALTGNDHGSQALPSHDDRTPAMLFSMLVAETLASNIDIRPFWSTLFVAPSPLESTEGPAQASPQLARIRAPPTLC